MTTRSAPAALGLALLVLAVALLTAACGGAGGEPAGSSAASGTSSSSGPSAQGPHNEADVAFAAGMVPHHAQAVQMSDLLLEKDGVDPRVLQLARQIKAAQAPEIEQMQGWLAGWGEVAPDPAHAEMDHSGHGASGMMSEDDLAALAEASGDEASRLFLEQMTVHHQGAIAMARTELAAGSNPDARRLAEDIIAAQEAEIARMAELLG